jgi:hypothetical protein
MRRSTLEGLLQTAGVQPTPAAVAYDLGGPVPTTVAARALAARVEAGAAATYADLVTAASGALRRTAAGWLADAAVRETGWSGRPPSFPGLPERP